MTGLIDAPAIARAFLDPTRRFDRYHYHYAKAKLATDPLYGGVLVALAGDAQPLLDVGCGIGLMAHVLRDAGALQPYVGVDFDAKKIASANAAATRAGLRDVVFATCDLVQGFPEHRGSVAILDVLQYLPESVQARVLADAMAAVVPGGRLVIRTGLEDESARSRVTGFADHMGRLLGWMRSAPKRYPRRDALDATLRDGGFEVEWAPLRGNTPFNNYLVIARKPR